MGGTDERRSKSSYGSLYKQVSAPINTFYSRLCKTCCDTGFYQSLRLFVNVWYIKNTLWEQRTVCRFYVLPQCLLFGPVPAEEGFFFLRCPNLIPPTFEGKYSQVEAFLRQRAMGLCTQGSSSEEIVPSASSVCCIIFICAFADLNILYFNLFLYTYMS